MDNPADPEQSSYWEHVDRDPNDPEGVRVVEFLNIAYSKGEPPLAIYRPLDTNMFVYKNGGWDFKPMVEFRERYRQITDPRRIVELHKIVKRIY